MHPSGVQFGLSRGLRQLRGEEILLSDQLLDDFSSSSNVSPARQTCDSGQFPGGYHRPRGVAERAGLAHREPRRLLTNPDFWSEFTAKAVDLVFGAALHGLFTPAALPADEMRDDTLGILDEFDRRHAHAREKRSL